VFALPIFPGERADCRLWREKGGERVAAVGKMQACFVRRSSCRAPQQERRPPSIVGVHVLNFCVRDGERADCRLWREKGGERVAAVGKMQACFVRRSNCRAPQQDDEPERRRWRKQRGRSVCRGLCATQAFIAKAHTGNRKRKQVDHYK